MGDSTMSENQLTGIDVSHYQGDVNWSEVKGAGESFVSIKATEHSSSYEYANYYTDNIVPARDAGLVAGGFHFFVGNENGKQQADYFLRIAKPQTGDLLPMLDLEQTSGASGSQFAAGAITWLETVGAAVGQKPFIYTTASFWSEIGNPSGFEDYPLWVAEYGVSAPKLPIGWTIYTIWQHSQNGQRAGVSGDVDLDQLNGSESVLDVFRV